MYASGNGISNFLAELECGFASIGFGAAHLRYPTRPRLFQTC